MRIHDLLCHVDPLVLVRHPSSQRVQPWCHDRDLPQLAKNVESTQTDELLLSSSGVCADTLAAHTVSLLTRSGERLHALFARTNDAPDELEDLVESRADASAGDGDACRVDELSGLDASRLC